MVKKKIKVSDKEQSLIDTMNENLCKRQEHVEDPVKEVYADAYPNVEIDNETVCRGKGCMDTSEPEVLKPIEEEIPIDYVDTSKPYVPNLPEPELYVNEDNRDSRISTTFDTTKNEIIKSKDIAKDILSSKINDDHYAHLKKLVDYQKRLEHYPELRDEFIKSVIPQAKDLCDRVAEMYEPLKPHCGSTNGDVVNLYHTWADGPTISIEEKVLKCLDIMRGNSNDTPVDDKEYENVNHPNHYNTYDVEVIDMMERIWGPEKTAIFCELNAFKYRMRMGTKPTSPVTEDLEKEVWYLNKMKELKNKA